MTAGVNALTATYGTQYTFGPSSSTLCTILNSNSTNKPQFDIIVCRCCIGSDFRLLLLQC